jgi:drug/metabolite transporter (DMT)-like permease
MSAQMSKGVQLAIVTAVVSGIANFVNKYAVGAIKPPLVFTAVKNLWVGMLIVGMILLLGKWKQIAKLKKDEVVKLLAVALVGGTVPFYLYFTGLSQISAINASLIHKTMVIWIAIMAGKWLKERLTKTQMVAVGLLFASNLIVGGFSGFKFSTGELMVLAATILWAVENVIAKKVLKTVDPDLVTGARMGIGSLVLMGAALLKSPTAVMHAYQMSGTQWMWMMVTAGTLLLYVMTWYRALKLEKATTVAAILVAGTLVTNVLSAVFTTHQWTTMMLAQAVFVLGGVALIYWQARQLNVANKPAIENVASSS